MIPKGNYSETINMVPMLKKDGAEGEKLLREMGQTVIEDFNDDKLSRKTWEENVANDIKLFNTVMESKNDPWPGASNIILPVLSIACIQYHARAFDALVPSKDAVQCFATGLEDVDKAARVSKYMNYQLLYQMTEFEEGMDKSLLQQPIVGCAFRKTYFDPALGRNVSSYVSAQDLVVRYTNKVNIEEVDRKTHVIPLTVNECRIRARTGIFDPLVWNLGPGQLTMLHSGSDSILKQAMDSGGFKDTLAWQNRPRIFLEQHRGYDIDGDGIEEPLVITVDYETWQVVRITDRRHYDFLGNEQVLEYFTKYGFIPNPEGFYDIGFGTLIRGLNRGCNDILNEVIDAGKLANLQGGFVAKRSGVKRGSLTFKMGEYKEVDAYTDDINKAIYHLDFKGPNQTLYAVLGLLYEYSKLVSSVSETMTGQLPASDTPATTVMAIIEEGRKVFSTIQKRNHRAFKKELSKLFRLNSIFLDEKVYFHVLGDKRVPTPDIASVVASDFVSSIDVLPISDPTITSTAERILKAQQAFELTLSSPLTAQNQNSIYIAQRKLYEALDTPYVDELLQPPVPPNLSPEEENAGFITIKPATALPQQDHMHHIEVHDSLVNSEFGANLTPEGKKLVEAHRREHLALLYLQQNQPQQMAAGGNGGRLQGI